MTLPIVPFWIDRSVPWAAFAFAVTKGSVPERIIGALSAASLALNTFVVPHGAGEMLPLNLLETTVSLATVAGLAVSYDRWWLIAAGSIKLVLIGTILGAILIPMRPWAIGTALWTWSWIFVALLAHGTWESWRRRRAGVIDQPHFPWKPSLRRA